MCIDHQLIPQNHWQRNCPNKTRQIWWTTIPTTSAPVQRLRD